MNGLLRHTSNIWRGLTQIGLSNKEKDTLVGLGIVTDNLKTALLIKTNKINPNSFKQAVGLVFNFET